ncbi:MAG: hypothetical protein WAV76_08920 [Bacteroidota bacterium]
MREFKDRGCKWFDIAREKGSNDELRRIVGEWVHRLSFEEWQKSPWADGRIIIEEQ